MLFVNCEFGHFERICVCKGFHGFVVVSCYVDDFALQA